MNKINFPLIYKLSIDLLLFILIGLSGFILLENILPGYFASITGISFLKIFTILGIFIFIIYFLSQKSEIKHEEDLTANKKALIILALPISLLIANSLWKFSIISIFILTIITVISLYWIYIILLEEK